MKKAKLQYFEKMSGLSSKKARKELNQVLGLKGSNGIEADQIPNDRLTDHQSIADEFNRYFSSWSGYLELIIWILSITSSCCP